MRKLLDSNILIYSLDRQSPYFRLSKGVLLLDDNFIALQNLDETFRVVTSKSCVTNPLLPNEALKILLKFYNNCNVLFPNSSTWEILNSLIEKYLVSSYQIYDTLLVAHMLDYGIDTIFTNNVPDFKKFTEIKVINPFA